MILCHCRKGQPSGGVKRCAASGICTKEARPMSFMEVIALLDLIATVALIFVTAMKK